MGNQIKWILFKITKKHTLQQVTMMGIPRLWISVPSGKGRIIELLNVDEIRSGVFAVCEPGVFVPVDSLLSDGSR